MKGCGEFAKDLKYFPRVYCSPRFPIPTAKNLQLSIRVQLNGERDRVPRLKAAGAHTEEKFSNTQIACRIHAYENGINKPEIVKWKELF
jgi:hypothetical protein